MKLKFGAIVVDGSGKIGGHVVSKNRGGKYLRTKVTPNNPNTVSQQAARALLSSLSTAWAALTEAQRLSFNNAVASFATTDIFGDIKNPSGFNLYVKLNANLQNTGQALISSAPEKIEVPYAAITDAIAVTATNEFPVNFDGTNYAGVQLLISATPAVSQGKTNVNSLFRGIGTLAPVTNQIDIWDLYVAKFGEPVAGQNISLQFEPVVETGQKGTKQSIKATITV